MPIIKGKDGAWDYYYQYVTQSRMSEKFYFRHLRPKSEIEARAKVNEYVRLLNIERIQRKEMKQAMVKRVKKVRREEVIKPLKVLNKEIICEEQNCYLELDKYNEW